jgi:hypothetical protein
MDDFTRHVLSKKDIVRAARFGRLDLVQQCLGQNEEEAICAAIKEGHTSIVEYLLDKVNGENISDSVLEGIRNGNSKTIEVVMNSRLQGYVHFSDMMVALVYNNCFDMVRKFLNDERLDAVHTRSQVNVLNETRYSQWFEPWEEARMVTLLSYVLEYANTLEMAKLLISSERFNKQCVFAALKAIYETYFDIFHLLRPYVDLNTFDRAIMKAAISSQNIDLIKYLHKEGCEVYVSDIEFGMYGNNKIVLFLIENGKVSESTAYYLERTFLHLWSSFKQENLETMECILKHSSTNMYKIMHDLKGRLKYFECEERTNYPEWDLLLRYADISNFLGMMSQKENLIKYVWENYPELHTLDNMKRIVDCCKSGNVAEMILKDNRFDPTVIDIYLNIIHNEYEKVYVLLKDPRTMIKRERLKDYRFKTNYPEGLQIFKLMLKKTQARDVYPDIWEEILAEERKTVEKGVHLYRHLDKMTLVFTLQVMKYDEEVYMKSSMIGPNAVVFAYYTTLLKNAL